MNGDVKTKIIKRNGEEVTFDLDKIINAITKANEEVTKIHQMNQYQIMAIAEKVADQVANSSHAVNVEDVSYTHLWMDSKIWKKTNLKNYMIL